MSRERCPIAVVDTAGNVIENARVRIYRRNKDGSAGALASSEIFVSEDSNVLVAYPLVVDEFGRVDAWAEWGSYLIDINDSTDADLGSEPWDASPARRVPAHALGAVRVMDKLNRMETYGHSLAFSGRGGSATDTYRDSQTRLATLLKAAEMPRAVGGAILAWHDQAGSFSAILRGTS